MEAFRIALQSRVDCIEVDVSRTSDGFLVALHDRCAFFVSSVVHSGVID